MEDSTTIASNRPQHRRREVRGLLQVLRGTTGAIDLASIMVGVIIVGVLAGIIAASVFTVIPWSQDNAARQTLDAVKTAESVAKVQKSKYLTMGALISEEFIQSSPNVDVATDTDGTCFVAAVLSGTGKTFYLTSRSAAALEIEPPAEQCVPAPQPGDPDGGWVQPDMTGIVADEPALTSDGGYFFHTFTGAFDQEPYASGFPWLMQRAADSDVDTFDVTDVRAYLDGEEISITADGYEVYKLSADFSVYAYGPVTLGDNEERTYDAFNDRGLLTLTIDGVENNRIYGADYGNPDGATNDGGEGGDNGGTPDGPSLAACVTYNQVAASANATSIVTISRVTGQYDQKKIEVSHDGGETWTSSAAPGAWMRVSMSANGQVIAAIDENLGIHVSRDGGASWTPRSGRTADIWWSDIDVSGDGTKIAAAGWGFVIISTDGGATWTEQSSLPGSGDWSDVEYSGNGSKLAIVSTDGDLRVLSGGTWSRAGRGWAQLSYSTDGSRLIYRGFALTVRTDDGDVTEFPNVHEDVSRDDPSLVVMSGDGEHLFQDEYYEEGLWAATVSDGPGNWVRVDGSGASYSELAVSTNGGTLVATRSPAGAITTDVFVSDDGGYTWANKTDHGDCSWKDAPIWS